MKITNKNIHWWLVYGGSLLLVIPFFTYGISSLTIRLAGWGIFISGIASLYSIIMFLLECSDDTIKFEIDLTKLFKTKRISPEEEDKQNK